MSHASAVSMEVFILHCGHLGRLGILTFFIFYIFSLIDDGWWAGRQGYRGVQSDLGGHHICAGALKKQNKNIYNSLNL